MYLLNFVILFFLLILIRSYSVFRIIFSGYQTYYLDVLFIVDGTLL